jgi:hypothetical protein
MAAKMPIGIFDSFADNATCADDNISLLVAAAFISIASSAIQPGE